MAFIMTDHQLVLMQQWLKTTKYGLRPRSRRRFQDNSQFSWPIRGNTPKLSMEKVMLRHYRIDSNDTQSLKRPALAHPPSFQPNISPSHCSLLCWLLLLIRSSSSLIIFTFLQSLVLKDVWHVGLEYFTFHHREARDNATFRPFL